MNEALDPSLLERLSEWVCARMGLNFAADRWDELERGIGLVAGEFGFADAGEFARWLFTAPVTQAQIANLAAELTVGETYFFREAGTFDVLRRCVLPKIFQSRRGREQRLRIWSAGCCTGEEAYSLAILLDETIPDARAWDISILATDINPRFLARAREGRFGEWSFRGVAPEIKARYFTRTPRGGYEIQPQFKERITFSQLNLADEVYPSPLNGTEGMDIIVCRNVMIYMSAPQVKRIVQRFERSLGDSGWLIVGATEASPILSRELATVVVDGVTVYQKDKTGGRFKRTEPPRPSPAAIWTAALPMPIHPPVVEVRRGVAPKPSPIVEGAESSDSNRMAQMAREHADQGKLEAARQWCDSAVEADKLNPSRHYLRGAVLAEMGQWVEAAAAYRRALFLEPDFVMVHVSLGYLMRRHGKLGEARRHWKSALSLIHRRPADEIVPESDGLTSARLEEMLSAVTSREEIAP